ncbi:hypothetical protein [Aliikangiella sp. IMCC44359]|uniref:hypothetical protein n=1 Tax=Aliikangiella sp. IMCC44359 TaxID=3459125 RepID=UPI00403ABB98
MKCLYNKIFLLFILPLLLSWTNLSHAENYLSPPIATVNSEAIFDVEKLTLQDVNSIASSLTINKPANDDIKSNNFDSNEVNGGESEILNDIELLYESPSILLKLNQYFPDGLPFTSTLLNAVFFRSYTQTNPIYYYKSIQEPPFFIFQSFDELFSLLDVIPWFMQPVQFVKNRVSGWKEGSFLYTACITYY